MGVRLGEVRKRRPPSGLNAESGKRLGGRVMSAEVSRADGLAGGWGRGGRDVRWGVDYPCQFQYRARPPLPKGGRQKRVSVSFLVRVRRLGGLRSRSRGGGAGGHRQAQAAGASLIGVGKM